MIASYNELANKLNAARADFKAGDKKAAKKVQQLSAQLRQIESEAAHFTGPNLGNYPN
jgi:hypothetical protein